MALGATKETVLRARMFLAPGANVREPAKAQLEVLGDVAPANTTLFVAASIGDGLMVEVDLDALCHEDRIG